MAISDFRDKLECLINCENMERGSDTPDFVLADYLSDCLVAFDRAVSARGRWYNEYTAPCDPSGSPICEPLCDPAYDALAAAVGTEKLLAGTPEGVRDDDR
jgi:hypothetical protein